MASHPFPGDGGSKDNRYEVFDVSASGSVTPTGTIFQMGTANSAESLVTFTPDGVVGLVVQDDGTLGVFRFDDGGTPTVVNPGFSGGFYANHILMSPNGNTAWVIDMDTPNNGGGLYQVAIACDGTLSSLGQVLSGDAPTAGTWLNTRPGVAMIAARGMGPVDGGQAYLVDFNGSAPTVVGMTHPFPDPDAIPPTVSLTPDDAFAAIPDDGFLAGDRLAIVVGDGGSYANSQLLTTSSPIGVGFSPFARRGLVVNTNGTDGFHALDFINGSWQVAATALPYTFGKPQLPGAPDLLTRGALEGWMFIAELDSVRVLRFDPDGGITDVSKTMAAGSGIDQILGTLGIQP